MPPIPVAAALVVFLASVLWSAVTWRHYLDAWRLNDRARGLPGYSARDLANMFDVSMKLLLDDPGTDQLRRLQSAARQRLAIMLVALIGVALAIALVPLYW